MAIRGQKFELDLSDDEGQFNFLPVGDEATEEAAPSPIFGGLIGEIKERDAAAPPSAPKFKATPTGFPAHRKRSQPSKFKQSQSVSTTPNDPASLAQRAVQRGPSDAAIANQLSKKHGISADDIEKQRIDKENKERLQSMSVEEIEEARNELLAGLNPTIIEKLLKRANIDGPEGAGDTSAASQPAPESQQSVPTNNEDATAPAPKPARKTVSFDTPEPPQPEGSPPTRSIAPDDAEPTTIRPHMHFPLPPQDPSTMPNLNPNSPSFLADLQTHYFPSTPADPTALTWLQDPTPQELQSSPYNPLSKSNIPVSSLRFSFSGALIPPSISSTIDPREGLHHHGLDPDSAGYTIPELSILSRSTVPGQKCISFMILGRILFRLGSGAFGDQGTLLTEGLWECIEKERGLEVMLMEAAREEGRGGNRSVKAHATEGMWLWRQGLEKGGIERERGFKRQKDGEEEGENWMDQMMAGRNVQ